jgi:hypothetical protein
MNGYTDVAAVHRDVGRRRIAVIAILAIIASAFVFLAAPRAGALPLTNVQWSVSNNQKSTTGVTYTYSFTTGGTNTIATVDFAVSGAGLGDGGSVGLGVVYGLGAGTASRSGQTITYTVSAPASVPAGTPIYIEFTNLTNTATTGNYTTSVSTKNGGPALDGPTVSNTVSIADSNTAVSVTIAKSLTFTTSASSYQLGLDPGLPALADQSKAVTLTVLTNANQGYTLSVANSATGLRAGGLAGTPTVAAFSTGKGTSAVWGGAVDKYGYTVGSGGGSPTIDNAFSGSKYAGFKSAGESIASRTTPTGNTPDSITLTNRVAIDYAQSAGTYTDTLTYTVVPNYS